MWRKKTLCLIFNMRVRFDRFVKTQKFTQPLSNKWDLTSQDIWENFDLTNFLLILYHGNNIVAAVYAFWCLYMKYALSHFCSSHKLVVDCNSLPWKGKEVDNKWVGACHCWCQLGHSQSSNNGHLRNTSSHERRVTSYMRREVISFKRRKHPTNNRLHWHHWITS